MKANTLMIGNYISAYDKIYKVTANTLVAIESNYMGGSPYEPIPLTEEWLLKFGFIYKEYSLFSRLSITVNSFTIEFEIGDSICDCYVEMIGIDIKYVHELQNLYFALTGKELELNQKHVL